MMMIDSQPDQVHVLLGRSQLRGRLKMALGDDLGQAMHGDARLLLMLMLLLLF